MRRFVARYDRGIANERVVDAGVRHQVGLEFVEINIQGAIESQRRRDRADDLRNESVEMLIVGSGDIEVTSADVIDGLVVDKECAI